MVSFLIDAALAVLLVTATVYLVVVNKRLKLLRTGQSEINTLVSTFSRSIDDTDASMKRLVASATDIATRLSDELDRAKAVKEDMTLILGSCERAATRMEESVHHARALLRRLDEGAMRAPDPGRRWRPSFSRSRPRHLRFRNPRFRQPPSRRPRSRRRRPHRKPPPTSPRMAALSDPWICPCALPRRNRRRPGRPGRTVQSPRRRSGRRPVPSTRGCAPSERRGER